MAFDWQAVITSLGGDAVLLGAVAWLIKQLVSNRLTMEAEKFKADIKAKADVEIERAKAFLSRGSHVHERQLDILQKLYRPLQDAQGLLQRMTSAGRFGNEITPNEYELHVTQCMETAFAEFSNGRLFIPIPVVEQCEKFFQAVFEGRQNFAWANHPMIQPQERAEFWTTAAKIAHDELPTVLRNIEASARLVIHGDAAMISPAEVSQFADAQKVNHAHTAIQGTRS